MQLYAKIEKNIGYGFTCVYLHVYLCLYFNWHLFLVNLIPPQEVQITRLALSSSLPMFPSAYWKIIVEKHNSFEDCIYET